MGIYIYSTDITLKNLEATNRCADLFKLIGIYDKYDSNNGHLFFDFYDKRKDSKEYRYQNTGEKIIKKLLPKNPNKPKTSRRVIRRMCQTKKGYCVKSHPNMGIVYKYLIKYIYENETLWRIAVDIIAPEVCECYEQKFLYFQYNAVDDYVFHMRRKHEDFQLVLNEWYNSTTIIYKAKKGGWY